MNTNTIPPEDTLPTLPAEPGWFDGLSGGTWFVIGVSVCALVGYITFMLMLGRTSRNADLKVRGWENRPKSTDDQGEWWAREYPEIGDLPAMDTWDNPANGGQTLRGRHG